MYVLNQVVSNQVELVLRVCTVLKPFWQDQFMFENRFAHYNGCNFGSYNYEQTIDFRLVTLHQLKSVYDTLFCLFLVSLLPFPTGALSQFWGFTVAHLGILNLPLCFVYLLKWLFNDCRMTFGSFNRFIQLFWQWWIRFPFHCDDLMWTQPRLTFVEWGSLSMVLKVVACNPSCLTSVIIAFAKKNCFFIYTFLVFSHNLGLYIALLASCNFKHCPTSCCLSSKSGCIAFAARLVSLLVEMCGRLQNVLYVIAQLLFCSRACIRTLDSGVWRGMLIIRCFRFPN